MSAKKSESTITEADFFQEAPAGRDVPRLQRMRRDPALHGQPEFADVHPDEVERWAEQGWERI